MSDKGRVIGKVEAEKAAVLSDCHIENLNMTGDGSSPPEPPSGIPYDLPPRNPKFAGRKEELSVLHEKLSKECTLGVTQEVAAYGQGGLGKSALCCEYAWEYLEEAYPGGAFWISAELPVLTAKIASFAPQLGLQNTSDELFDAAMVKTKLEDGKPSLIILDNVSDASLLRDKEWTKFLPRGACKRLLTTRLPALPGVEMYPLDRLSKEDGIALLTNYREDASEKDAASALAKIIRECDGLAVALTLVGVYMQIKSDLSWSAYAKSLEDRGLDTLRATEEVAATHGGVRDYTKSLQLVLDDTLQALPEAERRVLSYAALFSADMIPLPWLVKLLESDETIEIKAEPGYEGNPGTMVVESLLNRRVLQPGTKRTPIGMLHRVLGQRIEEVDKEEQGELLAKLVAFAEHRAECTLEAITEKELRWELSPLASFAELLAEKGEKEKAAAIASKLATPMRGLGRYSEMKDLLERFVGKEGHNLGEDPLQQGATTLSNLAGILQDLGDFKEARKRIEQAITINEKHFEPDHPALAVSYSNLATVLKNLGDLKEARKRIEQAIAINEKHFEPDHPTMAISYSNLAMILKDLGDSKEARKRMEQAVVIEEKHFEPDHPVLAISYSNQAIILKDLGDLKEARKKVEQAIAINEKHLEPDHPTLAISYLNLGDIFSASGEEGKAKTQWRKAERIALKNFTKTHPLVKAIKKRK